MTTMWLRLVRGMYSLLFAPAHATTCRNRICGLNQAQNNVSATNFHTNSKYNRLPAPNPVPRK